MRRIILTLLGAFIVSTAYSLSAPKATVSEYLKSTGAGFAMSPEEGVRYRMNFALLKTIEGPIYATVLFENPEKGAASMRKEVLLPTGAKELVVQSEKLTFLRNNKMYLVEVQLFSDEVRTHLIGNHKQEVLFSVPAKFVSQLERQYGIRIQ